MKKHPEAQSEKLQYVTVESAEDLAYILRDSGIDTTAWGQAPFKSVERLHQEIANGESQLIRAGSALGRLVSIVSVDVRAEIDGRNYRLKEDRQEFTHGGSRRRNLYGVSEKIQGNEDPKAAARRGLLEELGVTYTGQLTADEIETDHQASSHSYPGLPGVYQRYPFTAVFDELDWNEDGYTEVQPDKTTYFVWEDLGEQNL